MTIAEQYLCRALCYGTESKSMENLEWHEGYLGWVERMGYPLGQDTGKDNTAYYIGCRVPNSIADWGLPYPQAKFYIPENMRHTITRYTGYQDLHGVKVFNGDIIQNIDSPEVYYYINNNKVYEKDKTWYFLHEYAKAHTNKFDGHIVVGNIFEWQKLNPEAKQWFTTANFYRQNIRGD